MKLKVKTPTMQPAPNSTCLGWLRNRSPSGTLDTEWLSLLLLEHRRLLDVQSHIERDGDQDGAEEERQPPAPAEEGIAGLADGGADHEEDQVGQQQARADAELGEHAVEAALGRRCVLSAEQRRTRPLAADGEALGEPEEHQQDRREDADHGGRRDQSDRDGGEAHDEQSRDQRALAADPIAEVAEDGGTDRPGEEGNAEGRERQQCRDDRRLLREEHLGEHQRCRGAVDVEVVVLDGGADEAREGHPTHRLSRRRSRGSLVDARAAHSQLLRCLSRRRGVAGSGRPCWLGTLSKRTLERTQARCRASRPDEHPGPAGAAAA